MPGLLDPALVPGFAKEADRAWAAGFFDGEGTVNFRKSKKGLNKQYYTLHVSIGQNVREPLDELVSSYGGSIYTYAPKEGRKLTREFFQWSIVGSRARIFLEHILPYLRVKRTKVEAALNSWAGRKEVMPI